MTQKTIQKIYDGFVKDARHYSDKGTSHSYLQTYEDLFSKFRNEKIDLLEIGTQRGWSLHLWWHCFPNANIVGTDIKISSEDGTLNEGVKGLDRITLHQCDSLKLNEVSKIFDGSEFDIIIDDGDHAPISQATTFNNFIGYLKSGGVYVIEDVKYDQFENIPFKQHFGEEIDKNNLRVERFDLRKEKGNRSDNYLIIFHKP